MSPEAQAVVDAVARNRTVDGSAIALIGQLKEMVATHAGDNEALGAAVADLMESSDQVEAAIFEGTPSAKSK